MSLQSPMLRSCVPRRESTTAYKRKAVMMSQSHSLLVEALRIVCEYLSVLETTRLIRLANTRRRLTVGLLGDIGHRGPPLKEPYRWIPKPLNDHGGFAMFCVECSKRMSHCAAVSCKAQESTTVLNSIRGILLEVRNYDSDSDEYSSE